MKALPKFRVALEACGTAPRRARLLSEAGHDLCLISAKFAKPFVRTQREVGSGTAGDLFPGD
ncbi:hypothetical protein [Mangrovicoccus ximenensis]|uniref:hypothetical protein n=1 Tax=Mangrovicoccus ximenensis TaxID=1911570 RepID=UPI000D374BD9|nr:hypothetical protein [Mangrovicoccus ximenensis]